MHTEYSDTRTANLAAAEASVGSLSHNFSFAWHLISRDFTMGRLGLIAFPRTVSNSA